MVVAYLVSYTNLEEACPVRIISLEEACLVSIIYSP